MRSSTRLRRSVAHGALLMALLCSASVVAGEGGGKGVGGLPSPEELAEAIVRAHWAGQPLRETTASWFSRNADTLSLESSLRIVLDRYSRSTSPRA